VDPIQRRHRAALAATDLLARVVRDGGEYVLPDLLVAQLLVAALERPQGPDPGAGVDVLDLFAP
jgi:hypothetical protein